MGRLAFVNLPNFINHTTLETALKKVAEEVGWTSKVDEKYRKEYELGSVHEVEKHIDTIITLRGRLLTQMVVSLGACASPSYFSIYTGFPYGVASPRKVEEYLNAVSRNLGL